VKQKYFIFSLIPRLLKSDRVDADFFSADVVFCDKLSESLHTSRLGCSAANPSGGVKMRAKIAYAKFRSINNFRYLYTTLSELA